MHTKYCHIYIHIRKYGAILDVSLCEISLANQMVQQGWTWNTFFFCQWCGNDLLRSYMKHLWQASFLGFSVMTSMVASEKTSQTSRNPQFRCGKVSFVWHFHHMFIIFPKSKSKLFGDETGPLAPRQCLGPPLKIQSKVQLKVPSGDPQEPPGCSSRREEHPEIIGILLE